MPRRIALLLFIALCLLQPVWHAWLAPPARLPVWAALGLALLPLAPVAAQLVRRRPHALFWAGVVSLLYFCHGVMEGWAVAELRLLGTAEALIAFTLVCAVGADGWQRRQAAKAAGPAAHAPPL